MSTATFNTFFAMLAFACAAGTVAAIAIAVWGAASPQASAARELYAGLGDAALWLGGLVALVTTLGSLYYSLVAHYLPCELCWYQRICIYPLSIVLLTAAWRRDRAVWHYALAPAVIGLGIAAYHTQLQAFPKQRTFCDINNPCTTRFVWKFGFVSLPLMSLVAFCFVITMTIVAVAAPRPSEEDLPS